MATRAQLAGLTDQDSEDLVELRDQIARTCLILLRYSNVLLALRYFTSRKIKKMIPLLASVPRLWCLMKIHLHLDQDEEVLEHPLFQAIHHVSLTDASPGHLKRLKRSQITHLVLTAFTDSLTNHLPCHLTHLDTGYNFNRNVDHLPPTLQYLDLKGNFNRRVDHLPAGLRHLILGASFTKTLDHLPEGLISLQPGFKYNLPLDHLPSSLRELIIRSANYFNQPLDHLPPSLEYLDLSECLKFNQPLDHLPRGMKHLWLTSHYSLPLDHLPSALIELRLGRDSPEYEDAPPSRFHPNSHPPLSQGWDHLPRGLKKLSARVGQPIDHLPQELTHLQIALVEKVELDHLPAHLIQLHLADLTDPPNFRHLKLDHLPKRLQKLSLPFHFGQCLDHLPRTLDTLVIQQRNEDFDLHASEPFNKPLDHLPQQIGIVDTGDGFDFPVDHFPSTLRMLRLGAEFNQSVDHLPPQLLSLTVSNEFNRPLDHLPSSLEHLNFELHGEGVCHLSQKFNRLPPDTVVSIRLIS